MTDKQNLDSHTPMMQQYLLGQHNLLIKNNLKT